MRASRQRRSARDRSADRADPRGALTGSPPGNPAASCRRGTRSATRIRSSGGIFAPGSAISTTATTSAQSSPDSPTPTVRAFTVAAPSRRTLSSGSLAAASGGDHGTGPAGVDSHGLRRVREDARDDRRGRVAHGVALRLPLIGGTPCRPLGRSEAKAEPRRRANRAPAERAGAGRRRRPAGLQRRRIGLSRSREVLHHGQPQDAVLVGDDNAQPEVRAAGRRLRGGSEVDGGEDEHLGLIAAARG